MSLFCFPLFSSLPIELRLQIWRLAIPRSRIIEVAYPPMTPLTTPYLRTGCRMPALLSVSREAREEALKEYTLLGLNEDGYPGDGEYIAIHPTDILFLNFYVGDPLIDLDGWMGGLANEATKRAKIRRLAFRFYRQKTHGLGQVLWPENFMCYEWLLYFPELEDWFVVLGEDEEGTSTHSEVELVPQEAGRAKAIIKSIQKEVHKARVRYFGMEWRGPRVRAYLLSRPSELSPKPRLNPRDICWETISFVHNSTCSCGTNA